MSNEEVKATPEKSKWFNGKYKVTPGTSRLLQEAIFADGGEWAWVPSWQAKEIRNLNFGYILVSPEGRMSHIEDFRSFTYSDLTEKEPPQVKLPQPTKKEFKEGYWYKCITSFGGLEGGRYYKVLKCKRNLLVEGGGDFYRPSYLFDINSELPYGPAFQLGSPPSAADNTIVAKGEVVTRTIKVSGQVLTLSPEAANWLKGVMKNPVGSYPEDEDVETGIIREAIFHSLKWIHETDESISDEGMSWIG